MSVCLTSSALVAKLRFRIVLNSMNFCVRCWLVLCERCVRLRSVLWCIVGVIQLV